MMDFVYEISLSYCIEYFNMSKNVTWGRYLYFPLKEGVLQIFIALKNPLPQPSTKPQTFDSMANMLTITSLMRLTEELSLLKVLKQNSSPGEALLTSTI
jgi:hypothetical protein